MKRATLVKRTALVAGALVFLLVGAEAFLRVWGYSAPQFHRLDPDLGWTLREHRRGWHVAEGERVRVYVSPTGQRDREHFIDKPEGTYRIAVLGDEYSEALDVPVERAWWWRLGGALEACRYAGGRRVEMLNFGVGGYGTAQEHVMLESRAMRYRPDLVLLQFSVANDVQENSFALAEVKERPFFILDAHGVARLDESFAYAPAFDRRMQLRYRLGAEIADHARVFQLARQLPDLAGLRAAHAMPSSTPALVAPRSAVWEDAWRVTEAVLARASDFSQRNGARFALVAVPHPAQLGSRMDYPEQRLAALAQRSRFAFIALAPHLRREAYRASGSWTREGHEAAAAAVAAQLCK